MRLLLIKELHLKRVEFQSFPSMEEEQSEENAPPLRRSLRRMALTELNDDLPETAITPQGASPDEMVILQRGRRKKPLTWSPIDYDKTKILGPPREVTPDKDMPSGPKLNSKLRRRLILSPTQKSTSAVLGRVIEQKIRSLPRWHQDDDFKPESDEKP